MTGVVIVALDPSLTAFGMAAVLVGDGSPRVLASTCITTDVGDKAHTYAGDRDARRLDVIAHGLVAFLDAHQPHVIAAEAPAGAQGYRAAFSLGAALGVSRGVLAARGLACMLVQAGEVKALVAGSRAASKLDLAAAVTRATGWTSPASTKPAREAEHDAAGVALAVIGSPLVVALTQASRARALAVSLATTPKDPTP